MSHLELAIEHAEGGHAVFPVQPDKIPYPGFTNWEQRATIDPASVKRLWLRYPYALPAVAPGLAHRTVIDVDRKPGKPDGFESLTESGLDLELLSDFA